MRKTRSFKGKIRFRLGCSQGPRQGRSHGESLSGTTHPGFVRNTFNYLSEITKKASPLLSSTFSDGDVGPYRASVPGYDGRSPKRFPLKRGRTDESQSSVPVSLEKGEKMFLFSFSRRRRRNNDTKLKWTHGFNCAYMAAAIDGKNTPINLYFTCQACLLLWHG